MFDGISFYKKNIMQATQEAQKTQLRQRGMIYFNIIASLASLASLAFIFFYITKNEAS
jgi:hypothetical protein